MALASHLLGMPVSSGTPIDVWSVQGEKLSVVFEFGFASLDTSLFSGLDFQVTPPERSDVDVVFFLIEEEDPGENTIIFEAAGFVDTFTFSVEDSTTTQTLIPVLLQLIFEE